MTALLRRRGVDARRIVCVAFAFLAAGCGDDGGPATASTTGGVTAEIVVKGGQVRDVTGTLSTKTFLLDAIGWKYWPQSDPTAPALIFSDGSLTLGGDGGGLVCKSVVKADAPEPRTGDSVANSLLRGQRGSSTWTCYLSIQGPSVSTETRYTLQFYGVDTAGGITTLDRTFVVVP